MKKASRLARRALPWLVPGGLALAPNRPALAQAPAHQAAPPAAIAPAPASAAPQAQASAVAAGARQHLDETVQQTQEMAREHAKTAALSAVERARVESDIFTFGIFPNSAGFMDARLHARIQYAKFISSGIYLDYTTARAVFDEPAVSRSERLVREYRAELDVIKGILLISAGSPVAWSVEPGLNGKFIHQDIADSGYDTNSFEETVFRSSTLGVDQWVSSAKLDSTLVVGEDLTLDLSGEYLPFIYQRQRGTSVTSQFDDSVDFEIANSTTGYQLRADLQYRTSLGRYRLRGMAYENRGEVASQSSLVSGNFEYVFETFDQARRQDYWIELTHTADYLRWFGNLAPAFALGFQRKRISTADDVLEADTFKVGLLLEWL